MMYREIFTPKSTHQIIELPEEFIGREVEVIAFPIEKETSDIRQIENAFKFWKENSVDMTNFKFDRIEANER